VKRSLTVIIVMVLLVSAPLPFLAGCGSQGAVQAKERPAFFTDDMGRQVSVARIPERIVSAAPACTEILFALGLGDKVVGDTEYCNYPEEAVAKTKIGTFTNPNIETIVGLQPDLVLATGGVQKDVLDRMEQLGLNVYAVNAATFEGTVKDIRDIGEITGTSEQAEAIATDMETRASAIGEAVAEREAAGETRPKVFYEIFYEAQVWTAGKGSVISDLINRAGGINIADEETGDYYEFSVEKLISENPQVYLVGSGSMSNPGDVKARPGWEQMDAIKNGRIYVIPEDLVYRTGPRLIDGLEAIYAAIYPR
jgi:iron complex transport system substrate-binding protein